MKYIFLSGEKKVKARLFRSGIFFAVALAVGSVWPMSTDTVSAATIVPGTAPAQTKLWPAASSPFPGYVGRSDNQFSSFFCYRTAILVFARKNGNNYEMTYKYGLDTNDSALRIEKDGKLIQEKGSITSSKMAECGDGKKGNPAGMGDPSSTDADPIVVNGRWSRATGTVDLGAQQYRTDFAGSFAGEALDRFSFSTMQLNSARYNNKEVNYWCAAGFLNGGGGRDIYGSVGGTNTSGISECGPTSGADKFSAAAQYGYAFINDGGMARIGGNTVFCSGMPLTSGVGSGLNLNLSKQITAADNCGPDVKSSGKAVSLGCDCTGFLATKKYTNGAVVANPNAVARLSPLFRSTVVEGQPLDSTQVPGLKVGSLPKFDLEVASVNALDGYGTQWVGFPNNAAARNCFNTITQCSDGGGPGRANLQQAGTAIYVTYTFVPKAGVVPAIEASPQMTPRQGTITVKSSINNAATNNGTSAGLRHRVTRVVVPNGSSLKQSSAIQGANNGAACAIFSNNPTLCQEDWKSNAPARTTLNKGDAPSVRTLVDTAADIPFGGQVCYITSVNKYETTRSDDDWSYSSSVCVRVAKRPSVKIYSTDLWSAGKVSGQINDMGNPEPFYGSSSQYGILANGAVNGFSSAGGLFGGSNSVGKAANGTLSAPSVLTFANTNPVDLGKLGAVNNSTSSVATMFTQLADKASGTFLSLNSATMKQWADAGLCKERLVYNINTALVIDQNITIPTGCSVIIVSNKTVTIKANITYADNGVSSPRELPQLVIVAPNINIEANVGRIDSWLFAYLQTTPLSGSYGTINTCSDVAILDTSRCNSQLTIHGYTAAAKYLLKRTYGSDGQSTGDNAAEIFNAGADATLWQKYQIADAASGNSAITQKITQLPPRY